MSKLIVEMEMPRFCAECPMCDNVYYGDGVRKPFCVVFDERKEILTEDRPSWCPICGVLPDEHDRLVREKDVRWAIDDIVLEIASRTGRVAMTKNETMEYVKRLPTIIAAERKDDGR